MSEDKALLLRSLVVERPHDPAPPFAGRRMWWRLAGGGALAGVALAGVLGFAPTRQVEYRADVAAAAPAVAGANPGAAERPGGGLVASGYVVARRKSSLAAEVTGKVVELLVEEGVVVAAGQVVAQLDSVLAEQDVALARSRVTSAEAAAAAIAADLRDAAQILGRVQTLSQKGFASDAERTRTEARVGVLSAQLNQARAQVATARLDAQRSAAVLEKHSIRAPFAGVVVERSAQPGEMISPMSAGGGFTRTGICTIVDMDSIEVEVEVNEAHIGRVHAGNAVTAALDAYPDWAIPASVIAVIPTANRDKATVKVRIGFARKDPRILPDMGVKVTFLEGSPPSAVLREETSASN
ncbi:MAG: efflux RND transporter periplasmic adaptor subunit [Pseudonocardiales bacterium]|nr:efflux RND transporter periplasmic adaptor subunit [Hyphomicrobiales bacterium]MBV8825522.1 efflux RND transporter periplasmic adaptor subunit [Hyphomicrobiales bacterium]MBV9429448.1 efflux RND transporter periplasmic adaptor subunit [Bradyrhizobiaceae bacterium]MBV9728116.1 efflux RND transporter periplasmic adaptor subunit [Pseudonocardiales bacterium]